MYSRKFAGIIFLLLMPLFTLFSSSAEAVKAIPDPTEQMRPFVDRIVVILTDPDLQGFEKCFERRQKVMKVAQERLDFPEMSKRVLGKQWRKLSQEEKQLFIDLFTTLLEHAYIGKIEDYSNQKVEFMDQRIKGERDPVKAQVNTLIIDKEKAISVSYIMVLKGQDWKVYDIVVENVSLVRNYMEQFKEILRKDGYASLIQQLEDKVKELEATTKLCPTDITTRGS